MNVSKFMRANALALLALLPPAGSAATDPLRVLYAPPHVMPVLDADAAMTLPVTIAAGTSPSVNCLQKAGVRPESGSDAQLLERFQVQRQLRALPDTAPAISLTIKDVANLAPGKYELLLYAFNCGASAPPKDAEPFVIQLARPAAKLAQPGKIVIERWLRSPWSAAHYRQSPASIALDPASAGGAMRIGSLSAQAGTFTMGSNNTPVGQLSATLPPIVEPGASVAIGFAPAQFPIGSASGQVTVRGKDLAEPLRLDLEIRSRLAPCWIIGMVIAGIALGWAVRVWLQRKIDLATARQPALEWLQSLRAERDKIPDPAFRRIADVQIAAVEDALKSASRDAASNALAKSGPVMDSARQALDSRLTSTASDIKQFLDGCDMRSPLPEPLAAIRSHAMAAGAAAAELLTPPNPSAAAAGLEAARRRLAEQLPTEVHRLQDAVQELGAALAPLRHVLMDGSAARLDSKLAAASAIAAGLDASDTFKLLRDAAHLVHTVRALLTWSADALEGSAGAFDILLHSRQPSKAMLGAERDELRAQLLAYAAAIRTQAEGANPVAIPHWRPAREVWSQTATVLLEAVAAGRAALHTGQEAIAAFRALVAEGSWVAALKQLSPGWEAPKQELLPAAAAASDLADAPASLLTIEFGRSAVAALPHGAGAAPPAYLSPQRNLLQLARAEAAMSVIVAVVLAWASFAFYQEKFIGTYGELLALFFWGFSADLSAQKLTEKIQSSGMLPK